LSERQRVLATPLDQLLADARAIRDAQFGSRVTYSPKVFIPLTMLCRDKCGYCTFAQPPARLENPYMSAEQVLAIKPQKTNLTLGVIGAYPAGSRFAYEVRAFYSSGGVTVEDPVTGSLNASLAQWLIGAGRFVPPYLASQGIAMGHAGEVHVSMDESKQVWIGGEVTACIQGTVEI